MSTNQIGLTLAKEMAGQDLVEWIQFRQVTLTPRTIQKQYSTTKYCGTELEVLLPQQLP